jgi:outer membrane protein assembly factor BamB
MAIAAGSPAARAGSLEGCDLKGTEVHELWTLKRPTPGTITPLLYGDRLYALDGRNGRIACLDPSSGKIVWKGDLDLTSSILASPTGGDGKVFVLDSAGTTLALAAGDELEQLALNRLGSSLCRASIAIDGDGLLIRTADALLAVGGR